MSPSASLRDARTRRSLRFWETPGWTSWRGCSADERRRRRRAATPPSSSPRRPPRGAGAGGSDAMRVAVYPGTFDPVTFGHLDLVERGRKHVDKLIIAILRNEDKQTLFTVPERTALLREAVAGWSNVAVDDFDGLLVEYAKRTGASLILRGLRAVSDFEYELQMAMMNRRLAPNLETAFLMPNEAFSYVSSRLVREVARLGGDVSGLVPPAVAAALAEKFGRGSRR